MYSLKKQRNCFGKRTWKDFTGGISVTDLKTSLILSQQTNCLREFRWCMHNLKNERLLGKSSYTVVYGTQFTWGNNCIYNYYRSCIQKHKHIGNMLLLYFIEEVVPYLVRQSIYCILSESSRQHKKKNILIKNCHVQKLQFTLFVIGPNSWNPQVCLHHTDAVRNFLKVWRVLTWQYCQNQIAASELM